VMAHIRPTLPVFCGMSGWKRTTCNMTRQAWRKTTRHANRRVSSAGTYAMCTPVRVAVSA
jgi:hypothetical protein